MADRIPGPIDRLRGWLLGWQSPGRDQVLVTRDGSDAAIVEVANAPGDPEHGECLPAVYACNRVISQAISTALLRVDRWRAGKWVEIEDHPLSVMWNLHPNPFHTRSELVDILARAYNLFGNAYCLLNRSRRTGQVAELEPVDAGEVAVECDERRRQITYFVLGKSHVHDPKRPLLLHIRQNARGYYPYEGRSPITYLREIIEAGLEATSYQRRIFSQGGHPQMALTPTGAAGEDIDPVLKSPEGRQRTVKQLGKDMRGAHNQQKILALPAGTKLEPLGVAPKDAAFMELAKWSRNDVASAFRVPPLLLGDLQYSSYANVRAVLRGFNRLTMAPIYEAWAQVLHRDILLRDPKLRVVFVPDQKDDPETATKIAVAQIGAGIRTPYDAGTADLGLTYEDGGEPSREYRGQGGGFGGEVFAEDEPDDVKPVDDGDDPDAVDKGEEKQETEVDGDKDG